MWFGSFSSRREPATQGQVWLTNDLYVMMICFPLMLEEMLLPTSIGLKGPSEWFEQYKMDLNNILWPSVTSSTQLNTYGRILRTDVFMLSTIMIKTPIEAIWCLLWSPHRESSTDLQNQLTLKLFCRLVLAQHLTNSQMNTFYVFYPDHLVTGQVNSEMARVC